jgi:hypothetical protein
MANESGIVLRHPDTIANQIVGSIGCQGTCNYTIDSSGHVTVTGQCTGGTGTCPKCPTSLTPQTIKLIKRLPTLIPNATQFPLSCALISADTQVISLYDQYSKLYRTAAFYRILAVGLGVVSLLTIGALIYMLIAR